MIAHAVTDGHEKELSDMKHDHALDTALRNGEKLSAILRALPGAFSATEIKVGELKDAFSGRTYGILLLVLALPNLIPIPAPGLSAVLGAPLVLFTFQLMLGMKTPWFPDFIARRRVKRADMTQVCARIVPTIERLELISTPRLQFLVRPPADRGIACVCLVLSLMIMMPIPFGNALPALAICLFALGLLQSDGLFVLLGIIATLAGATTILLFFDAILRVAGNFFGI
jgi:hypothetical protein